MRKRAAQFLLRLDERVLDRVRALADKEGRTVTDLLREATADLLRKRELKKSKRARN